MIHLNTSKILITTDFSDTSRLAFNQGAFLAQMANGEVFLLHVIVQQWEIAHIFSPGAHQAIRKT